MPASHVFSPLAPLFDAGKPLSYNQVLKAWPQSAHYEAFRRHFPDGNSIDQELEALVAAGLLKKQKRGVRLTWRKATK